MLDNAMDDILLEMAWTKSTDLTHPKEPVLMEMLDLIKDIKRIGLVFYKKKTSQ